MEKNALKYVSGYNMGFSIVMNYSEFEENLPMIEDLHRQCSRQPEDPYSEGFFKGYAEAKENLSQERQTSLSRIIERKLKKRSNRER